MSNEAWVIHHAINPADWVAAPRGAPVAPHRCVLPFSATYASEVEALQAIDAEHTHTLGALTEARQRIRARLDELDDVGRDAGRAPDVSGECVALGVAPNEYVVLSLLEDEAKKGHRLPVLARRQDGFSRWYRWRKKPTTGDYGYWPEGPWRETPFVAHGVIDTSVPAPVELQPMLFSVPPDHTQGDEA